MTTESFITIARLKLNYKVLSNLYKQGKFEQEVPTTSSQSDRERFYFVSSDKLVSTRKFSDESETSEQTSHGKKRNPHDLQWATRNLREQVQYLIETHQGKKGRTVERADEILCYFGSFSLSYEVDDYFLSVSPQTSNFLIEIIQEIVPDPAAYAKKKFPGPFPVGTEEYWEIIKQIFIVGLCGVNELYRRHQYEEGLEIAQMVLERMDRFPISKERWFGLRGLCFYIMGKNYTAIGEYAAAAQSFTKSVEAYSESISRKERSFAKREIGQSSAERDFRDGKIAKDEFDRLTAEFLVDKRNHEISRSVALRRTGLVTSFGYGFQSLVRGKVKDAIRLSSIARGIVNWNTGTIWSAYVDLIYFSAKRAENSSDVMILRDLRVKLNQCRRIFVQLIPSAHYKNRAIFQLALTYHYIARWHISQGKDVMASQPSVGRHHIRLARKIWRFVFDSLQVTINDQHLFGNRRLRAESMAIQGHALSNIALTERYFKNDKNDHVEKIANAYIDQAIGILSGAWDEVADHPQIQCEVGLAFAAVLKAKAELTSKPNYLSRKANSIISMNDIPLTAAETQEFSVALSKARGWAYKVLKLEEQSTNVRVRATAYLRLAEIALAQGDIPLKAREYLNEYQAISTQVQHDFCGRWAKELEDYLMQLDKRFTFAIEPGKLHQDKKQIAFKLEEFYREYAIKAASIEIEKDFAHDPEKMSGSCSSYIANALRKNFSIESKTAREWMRNYGMIATLQKICPAAKDLRALTTDQRPSKTNSNGDSPEDVS